MRRALPALVITFGLAMTASAQPRPGTGPSFEETKFGKMPDTTTTGGQLIRGPLVMQYTLTNKNGVVLKCIEYGAIITQLHVPDKNGKFADVVLGFDKFEDYRKGHPYFGTNAGRCGNRIANAKFTLDGRQYQLDANNGPHSLHGGKEGFDKKYWQGKPQLTSTGPSVTFKYTSPDGEEGLPRSTRHGSDLHAHRQQ